MKNNVAFSITILMGILLILGCAFLIGQPKREYLKYSYTCYSGENIIYSGTGLGLESFANGIFTTDEITKKKIWLSGTCIFTEI